MNPQSEQKLTLGEAATKASSTYPDIFTNVRQRQCFEADFLLLVQTFIMDGSYVSPLLPCCTLP